MEPNERASMDGSWEASNLASILPLLRFEVAPDGELRPGQPKMPLPLGCPGRSGQDSGCYQEMVRCPNLV